MERWIKINERLLDWQWFNDGNTLKVWLYLLVKANWKETKWQGLTLKRGQFVISVRRLSGILEMADKTVQRALKALLDSDCIEVKPLGKMGTLVTIKKYSQYQATVVTNTTQVTTDDTTENTTQVTTRVKNIEEDKEYKNISSPPPTREGRKIDGPIDAQKAMAMIDAWLKDGEWMYETSERVMMPVDEVTANLSQLRLLIKAQDTEHLNRADLISHIDNYLRKAKTIAAEQSARMTRITTKPSTNGTDTNQRAKLDKYLEGLY